MARKKVDSGGGGGGEWLNTYADLVTLLLTFFILLFAMSSLDAAKFNMIVKARSNDTTMEDTLVIIGQAEGAPGGINRGEHTFEETEDIMLEIYNTLKDYVEAEGIAESVELAQEDGYVFISFSDNMLFEPNSARLRPSTLDVLNFVGIGIKGIQDAAGMICINGHTAAVPDDPFYPVSDRLLSADRANAILMYFEDQIGITPEKLILVAFGKNHPITTNDTEDGRARNRRVEILIQKDNTIAQQLDTIYEKLVD